MKEREGLRSDGGHWNDCESAYHEEQRGKRRRKRKRRRRKKKKMAERKEGRSS